MTISALFAALLLFVSASADPNSSEPIIDNASAGASDDQIAALPPVLALSDSETVTSAETLLECIINNAEYDLELASSMARVSRACPELIERRLAELWRRELRCPSSDLDLVRTLETILTQSERQFDRESFLVEIFDDDIAALVLRRLVFVATLLPNTIASLIAPSDAFRPCTACWSAGSYCSMKPASA
ncbi:hypothetical protein BVRB_030880 [Beta vulgaris subsp. vulgaris]|uniref:Secreted protein n=1 Tax=Beta vulgaris subsp. vulgaris TaxID=3555 RepID=A0A0J8B0R3_BETVV|nr:hypothetical protein BVRB_030880 [Beta vulgaris subsp. vulgaris]